MWKLLSCRSFLVVLLYAGANERLVWPLSSHLTLESQQKNLHQVHFWLTAHHPLNFATSSLLSSAPFSVTASTETSVDSWGWTQGCSQMHIDGWFIKKTVRLLMYFSIQGQAWYFWKYPDLLFYQVLHQKINITLIPVCLIWSCSHGRQWAWQQRQELNYCLPRRNMLLGFNK